MAPKKIVSSVRVSEASEKAIDKLNAKEFRERFLIPHDCVRSPALPSNGDRTARFDKGRGEGAGGSLGWMAGLSQHPSRPFSPNYTLKIPGFGIEGPPCGLGGKRHPLPVSANYLK
ncbi:hypothetical protein CK203_074587 [Vitis vinifera]|uniref:Uncharacterized protein n=1 Tax=Vitis vinifera TaxID=29760 RepID=A0A438DWG4_VITVI|nr:hypothetical protein CK203_074587 [Vitis vinifera]